LASFKGIRRRQEVLLDSRGIAIVDDFAHHPTAVARTIEAMRTRFPGRKLWAIFEPRSNTSRRNVFQREFARALSHADRAIIAGVHRAESIPEDERLSPQEIADALMQRGIDAHHIPSTEHIVEFVMRSMDSGNVILIMSNGNFDQLPSKLIDALKKRHIVAQGSQPPPTKVPG
jgi:UDP-N-acetylmuramate: L-alanyl-gamma-D-glutamyl-meso-diaminopimelate ligase